MIIMKCEIIRDLLPLYVDEICSKEASYEIESHLKDCDKCKHIFEQMNVEIVPIIDSEKVIKAKNPFNIIRKKKITHISLAVVTTIFIMIIGYMVVQNVGVVYDIVFPQRYIIVHQEEDIDIWNEVRVDKYNFLNFDNLMFKKCITNDANSNVTAMLRIVDETNNIVLDNIELAPGETANLKELKRNKNYVVQMKYKKGHVILNIY